LAQWIDKNKLAGMPDRTQQRIVHMSGPFVYQDVINEELLRIYAEKLFGHDDVK
jgi:hypothetical protein